MAALTLERKQKLCFKLGQCLVGFTFILHALLTVLSANKASDDFTDIMFGWFKSFISFATGGLVLAEHKQAYNYVFVLIAMNAVSDGNPF